MLKIMAFILYIGCTMRLGSLMVARVANPVNLTFSDNLESFLLHQLPFVYTQKINFISGNFH